MEIIVVTLVAVGALLIMWMSGRDLVTAMNEMPGANLRKIARTHKIAIFFMVIGIILMSLAMVHISSYLGDTNRRGPEGLVAVVHFGI